MKKLPVIEKGVPIPTRHQAIEFPFDEMEVGDSFLVEGISSTKIHLAFRQHKPKRFTARTVYENGVRAIRVWRFE